MGNQSVNELFGRFLSRPLSAQRATRRLRPATPTLSAHLYHRYLYGTLLLTCLHNVSPSEWKASTPSYPPLFFCKFSPRGQAVGPACAPSKHAPALSSLKAKVGNAVPFCRR